MIPILEANVFETTGSYKVQESADKLCIQQVFAVIGALIIYS